MMQIWSSSRKCGAKVRIFIKLGTQLMKKDVIVKRWESIPSIICRSAWKLSKGTKRKCENCLLWRRSSACLGWLFQIFYWSTILTDSTLQNIRKAYRSSFKLKSPLIRTAMSKTQDIRHKEHKMQREDRAVASCRCWLRRKSWQKSLDHSQQGDSLMAPRTILKYWLKYR